MAELLRSAVVKVYMLSVCVAEMYCVVSVLCIFSFIFCGCVVMRLCVGYEGVCMWIFFIFLVY